MGTFSKQCSSWFMQLLVPMFIFTFIISGVLLNVVQIVITGPLYFLNRRLFRVLNAKIVYFHWCMIPWAIQTWAKYDIRVYCTSQTHTQIANTEHALCVLNHRGDMDWMIGWCLIERIGMLGGVKAVMKDVAKYVPGIGWMFYFMEYPIVKRNWKTDQHRLAAACKTLTNYPVNMLLCLFAEGTRFTKEKWEVSLEVARQKGLPLLKHHLLPRTKGFVFLMKHLKGTIPAIYDITFAYRKGEPSILGVINRESCSCDMLVRRIPTTELKSDSEEALADFLYKLYQEKDEFVDYHMKNGRFPPPYVLIDIPMRPWPNVVVVVWFVILALPMLLFACHLLWIGEWFTLLAIVLVLLVVNQAFFMFVRLTQVKYGSAHGLDRVSQPKNGVDEKKTT